MTPPDGGVISLGVRCSVEVLVGMAGWGAAGPRFNFQFLPPPGVLGHGMYWAFWRISAIAASRPDVAVPLSHHPCLHAAGFWRCGAPFPGKF